MKISGIWQLFIIINQTNLAFVMKNSCLDEKIITPRQPRLTQNKKIMRNCQYQEIFITKNKPKNEK